MKEYMPIHSIQRIPCIRVPPFTEIREPVEGKERTVVVPRRNGEYIIAIVSGKRVVDVVGTSKGGWFHGRTEGFTERSKKPIEGKIFVYSHLEEKPSESKGTWCKPPGLMKFFLRREVRKALEKGFANGH